MMWLVLSVLLFSRGSACESTLNWTYFGLVRLWRGLWRYSEGSEE